MKRKELSFLQKQLGILWGRLNKGKSMKNKDAVGKIIIKVLEGIVKV